MRASSPLAITWPRLGVAALALALCAAAACVIGPKPDDPAAPVVGAPDADKQGDDGAGDFTNDAASADSAPQPPAVDGASDIGTLNGGGGCADAAFDGADGACPSVDAGPQDAGDAASDASDAGGEAPADDATSASDGAVEAG
jgi:hypothetical protein